MMMLLKKIWIAFQADLVGIDAQGNKYFESRYKRPWSTRKRRWGVFAKGTDSSQITPEWHLWLHFTTQNPPENPFFQGKSTNAQHNHSGSAKAYWPRFTQKHSEYLWKPHSVRKTLSKNQKSTS